jgi:hypothetical protein
MGVCFDGLTNFDKFHHVDTPFAAFCGNLLATANALFSYVSKAIF